jgi:hypothetical protein
MNPPLHKIVRVAKGIAIRNGIASRRRRQAIIKFAAKFGFVYFGHVDQHDDEHHIIRGLTVSSSYQDEHYSVGSFDGYDISLVDRYDMISRPNKAIKTHRWLIFEFDLHNGKDLPHIFLGGHSHVGTPYEKLFTSLPSMQKVPLGTFGIHSEEFTKRYSLYASATQFIEVERLFSTEITRTIAAHFWPLSIEIYEGSLYIYSDNNTVSANLLETMLKNGLWLATQIDERNYPFDKKEGN